jgi:hypothetical protein
MSTGDASYGRITDEAVEQVRQRLHKVYPIEEPFVRYVNADSIRHAARAIGDMNRLWIDREYGKSSRYGCCLAPPALLYGVTWGSWDMRRGEGCRACTACMPATSGPTTGPCATATRSAPPRR